MALTFDATLKDMARDCPEGFLAEFDRPPTAAIRLLNVDLSAVTRSPRPEHGNMDFSFSLVRLWEIDAERVIASELGVTPLAVLGRLPVGVAVEDGVAAVARRIVERLTKEASADRAGKLLTKALLLAGLRVQRNVALKIFKGIPIMQESDTYLMILEEGEAKGAREVVLFVGEKRLGPAPEPVKDELGKIADLSRLKRMAFEAHDAPSWQQIVETP